MIRFHFGGDKRADYCSDVNVGMAAFSKNSHLLIYFSLKKKELFLNIFFVLIGL